MRRRLLALFALVGIVLVAGCMGVTVTTEVGDDGDIERMSVDTEVDSMVYLMLEMGAKEEGYESVEEFLLADMVDDDDPDFDDISVTETDEGTHVISLIATDVDPVDVEGIDITVDGDTVRYETTNVPTDEFEDGLWGDDEFDADDDEFGEGMFGEDDFTLEFVVVMPGEITDTNADEVSDDGTTATWRLEAGESTEENFYAESDASADGLPGFGLGVAALALGLSALGLGLRRR